MSRGRISTNTAELFAWRQHPEGRLAEIIVLDQFSRNIYRDTAKAFAQDKMALVLGDSSFITIDHAPFLQVLWV